MNVRRGFAPQPAAFGPRSQDSQDFQDLRSLSWVCEAESIHAAPMILDFPFSSQAEFRGKSESSAALNPDRPGFLRPWTKGQTPPRLAVYSLDLTWSPHCRVVRCPIRIGSAPISPDPGMARTKGKRAKSGTRNRVKTIVARERGLQTVPRRDSKFAVAGPRISAALTGPAAAMQTPGKPRCPRRFRYGYGPGRLLKLHLPRRPERSG